MHDLAEEVRPLLRSVRLLPVDRAVSLHLTPLAHEGTVRLSPGELRARRRVKSQRAAVIPNHWH